MITFENVTKLFGKQCVLDNLSFEIQKKRITFIIGKSGEGKSVTIKHIMGLMTPNSGKVTVNGHDLSQFDNDQLQEHRRNIGMLFQHAALFDSMSAQDNIRFPLLEQRLLKPEKIAERIDEILNALDIKHLRHKFPGELSTGQRKRVGLARAMATKPAIILYDEPTTGMDPLIAEMIDELIVHVNQQEGITSVVISHDLKAALATAEHIIMLYKGKVELAGTPQIFKASKNPVIRQFFAGKVHGPMEFE